MISGKYTIQTKYGEYDYYNVNNNIFNIDEYIYALSNIPRFNRSYG